MGRSTQNSLAIGGREKKQDPCDQRQGSIKRIAEWIRAHLGPDYAWQGNIREMEQCLRNVMIRKSYLAVTTNHIQPIFLTQELLAHAVTAGRFSLEELTQHYVSLIYAAEGIRYDLAAKRLGIDWRTLKQRLK